MRLWTGTVAVCVLSCVGDSSTPVDAGADATTDAGNNGDVTTDVAVDADAGVVTTYSNLTDTSKWETFDLGDAANFGPTTTNFTGIAYTGGYVYLVATYGALIARYDTSQSFTSKAAWSIYDATSKLGTGANFSGFVPAGKYLYVVPGQHQVALRYDTTQTFASDTSWTTFDTTPNVGGEMMVGGAFDNRYVYFVPWQSANTPTGNVIRYDTMAPFDAGASWQNYDLRLQIDAGYAGFSTAAFDSHNLYLVPYTGSEIARYDTTSTFAAPSSWTAFDLTLVDPNATHFFGAAFALGHVYLSQWSTTASLAVRYDVSKPFGTTGSWEKFLLTDVDQNAKAYIAMQFDGRYVYWEPYPAGAPVIRYDTSGAFTDKNSWQSFTPATINPKADSLAGGMAFDGQYAYFAPFGAGKGVVVRFNAKTPPSIPTPTASFY